MAPSLDGPSLDGPLPRVLTLYELYVSVIFSASLAFQVPFDVRLVALLYITADDILTSLLAVSP